MSEFNSELAHGFRIRIGRIQVAQPKRYEGEIPKGVRLGILSSGRMVGSAHGGLNRDLEGPRLFLLGSRSGGYGKYMLAPPRDACFVSLVMSIESAEICGLDVDQLLDESRAGISFRDKPACGAALLLSRQIACCPLEGAAKTFYLSGKALELMSLVADGFSTDGCARGLSSLRPADIVRLKEVREMLLDNLSNPPSLADLARMHGMNIKKLSSGFQSLFGTTVFAFVAEARLERSFQLLTSGEMTVAQVAYQIGYNVSYFSTLFKKRFGVSPSDIA